MSNWITITSNDVLTVMAGKELEAVRSQALGDEQPDPLDDTISEIVQLVRGYVAKAYTLSEGLTVPNKLKTATLVLIRDRLVSRLPISDLTTPDRVAQTSAAWRLLRDVSSGTFQIDVADEPVANEVASTSPVQLVTSSRRRFSRETMDGL
jgi:hypothetical protein